MKITKELINETTYDIIAIAISVHKELGPGLLESIYEKCFYHELSIKGYKVEKQLVVPIQFRDLILDANLKLDLLIEDLIVVEIKAVEEINPITDAQILSYMKLLKKPKGIIINFCTTNIVKSAKHFVNEYFRNLPDK